MPVKHAEQTPATATSEHDVTSDALRAVEEAAPRSLSEGFEHEPELLAAVANALTRGAHISDIANAAHMTSLEVLDAADSLTYPVRPEGR